MAKPKLFIASAVQSLDVAYAAQEALEHDAEVTVWSQGVFEPSKYTLDSLVEILDVVDFGLFVFSPTDVVIMGDKEKHAVRDNVVFELGLFIGRLGRERAFMLLPRGAEELHLPTDLLGITPGLYDADRTDGNLVAALGPFVNKVRKSFKQLGPVAPEVILQANVNVLDEESSSFVENMTDCLALIESWMGSRPTLDNLRAIEYRAVDRELNLKPGAAKQYIVQAAQHWNYRPRHVGESVITFEESERPRVNSRNWIDLS